MLISYPNEKTKKIFETEKSLRKKYGQQVTKSKQRIKELEAADSLADIVSLPGPRCHELKGDLKGAFSVDLVHPFRLLFRPAEPVPKKTDGGIDLAEVKKVLIIGVEDTH